MMMEWLYRRYVRCIKPNADKQANTYSDNLVLDQLRYLGMLDIIRIRREGYPVHLDLEVFVDSYKCLCKGLFLPKCPREAVPKMLQKLNFAAKEWQVRIKLTWSVRFSYKCCSIRSDQTWFFVSELL